MERKEAIVLIVMMMSLAGSLSLGQAQPPILQPKPDDKIEKPFITPERYQKLPPAELAPIPRPVATLGAPVEPVDLPLGEVLLSVERHYPLLHALFAERGIMEGKVLSALGRFDLNLTAFDRLNAGTFDNHRFGVGLRQPLAFQGMDLTAGYRMGRGSFPVYYGDRKTAEGGEFAMSMTLPLLRDRRIDQRRAGVQTAQLGRALVEPGIGMGRIQFSQAAAHVYWVWVTEAHRLRIAQRLLQIAEDRDVFLRKVAEAKKIAKIEVVDNLRTIVDRRARLAAFQRRYEAASIDLSLFLRDEVGKPMRPDVFFLAPEFPEPDRPDPDALPRHIEFALAQRPELQSLQLQRQQLAVRMNLAQNEMLPSLNMIVSGAQDVGPTNKRDLDRAAYEAALVLDVPLQRRVGLGQIRTTQGFLAQLNAQEQFQRDQIIAEVENVISALTRAYEVRQQAKETRELAAVMEQAEVRRLQIGQSTILFVNLRELDHADAQLRELDAFIEYYHALADFYAVLGMPVPIDLFPPVRRHP